MEYRLRPAVAADIEWLVEVLRRGRVKSRFLSPTARLGDSF